MPETNAGMDYNFGEGPPLLFETMIFGASGEAEAPAMVNARDAFAAALWGIAERYSTWAQAESGHRRWVEKAAAALGGARLAG